uniref:MATH domain-containing protein n=1 Tax=Brassica campestris TaxID=3711 RepID=A0A3P6BK31_BRACM|nr:unnamed protein product [Brassica rapa]
MEKQSDKKITWVIKTFSSLHSEKVHSDIFVVGRCRWCLKAYPKGNKKANHLSLYLAVANSEYLPFGWKRHAKFSFTVVNQFSYKLSRLGGDCFLVILMHIISREGSSGMISLSELHDKEGFLVNGEVKIVLKVDVLEVQGKVDVSEESLPVMETIDVNGNTKLLVFLLEESSTNLQKPSSVLQDVVFFSISNYSKNIFEHIERKNDKSKSLTSSLNPYLKTAYMNILLSLTQTLCQSPWEISKDDLAEEYAALSYLAAAGFQLDWLGKKLDEVKEKKKKGKSCLAQLQEMEEELKPLRRKYSEMEAQMDKLKAELSAAKYPVSLYDDNV